MDNSVAKLYKQEELGFGVLSPNNDFGVRIFRALRGKSSPV